MPRFFVMNIHVLSELLLYYILSRLNYGHYIPIVSPFYPHYILPNPHWISMFHDSNSITVTRRDCLDPHGIPVKSPFSHGFPMVFPWEKPQGTVLSTSPGMPDTHWKQTVRTACDGMTLLAVKVLLKERWLKGVNAVHIAIYSDFIGFYSDLMGFYQPVNALHITLWLCQSSYWSHGP